MRKTRLVNLCYQSFFLSYFFYAVVVVIVALYFFLAHCVCTGNGIALFIVCFYLKISFALQSGLQGSFLDN